ncbi:MAG TPA: NfeD family protein [Actinomycetota bacterium]|nr:NfeD family protein [Actinomycetota bacterium]
MALLIGGTLAYLFVPFPWWVLVVVALAGVEIFEVQLWLRLRRVAPRSGHEALVGQAGVLTEAGRVRIAGTSYPARVVDGRPGERVIVEEVDGMTLVVRREGGAS